MLVRLVADWSDHGMTDKDINATQISTSLSMAINRAHTIGLMVRFALHTNPSHCRAKGRTSTAGQIEFT